MKTDKEVLQDLDHVEILKRPHLWPTWPCLPLKRWRNREMTSAVAVEDEDDKIRFYEGANLFNPESFKENVLRTAEEIIADGWVVD